MRPQTDLFERIIGDKEKLLKKLLRSDRKENVMNGANRGRSDRLRTVEFPMPSMRVISGSAGGMPLRAPSHDIRPTMDMVRGLFFPL